MVTAAAESLMFLSEKGEIGGRMLPKNAHFCVLEALGVKCPIQDCLMLLKMAYEPCTAQKLSPLNQFQSELFLTKSDGIFHEIC